jgi:hypothetical protein
MGLQDVPKWARDNELLYVYWGTGPYEGEQRFTKVKHEYPQDANCISSVAGYRDDSLFFDGEDMWHTPIIDLDMDATLVPSSTPGHHHLYIDKKLTYEQYRRLIEVMYEVALVEYGILCQIQSDKRTIARLPGVKKDYN